MEDREYYLHLLEEEIRIRKSQKLLDYVPHEKQKIFHLAKQSTRALLGGNRAGKTLAGAVEFLWHCTGIYPDWYPKNMRYDRAIRARIAATDFTKGVGEAVIPSLNEWLDDSLVAEKKRNPQGIPIKWVLKNGSVFDILTYEQTTQQFEGWSGDLVWFDEPPPRDKYIATLRGLVDRGGRAYMTMTPLYEPWIYDEIVANPDSDRVFAITVDIRDNPYLTEEYIRIFEDSMSEEEKAARLHGKFIHLTGLIYKEFDPRIHIIEPPKLKRNWVRMFGIDPHPRVPTACLWMAVTEQEEYIIYDELWLKDMSLEQIAHAIKVQEGEEIAHRRFIDPSMDKEDSLMGGFNVRGELMKHGIFCERANADPDLGKSRIKHALTPRYIPLYKTEVPRLRISRWCKQTIYEFQHYIWDEYRHSPMERDPKEKPRKKSDHFMDILRWFFNSDPHYYNVEEQEEEEVRFEGEYTKYPVRREKSSSYYSLIERGEGHG